MSTTDPVLLFSAAHQKGGVALLRRVWDDNNTFLARCRERWGFAVAHALEEGARKHDDLLEFMLSVTDTAKLQPQLIRCLEASLLFENDAGFWKAGN